MLDFLDCSFLILSRGVVFFSLSPLCLPIPLPILCVKLVFLFTTSGDGSLPPMSLLSNYSSILWSSAFALSMLIFLMCDISFLGFSCLCPTLLMDVDVGVDIEDILLKLPMLVLMLLRSLLSRMFSLLLSRLRLTLGLIPVILLKSKLDVDFVPSFLLLLLLLLSLDYFIDLGLYLNFILLSLTLFLLAELSSNFPYISVSLDVMSSYGLLINSLGFLDALHVLILLAYLSVLIVSLVCFSVGDI